MARTGRNKKSNDYLGDIAYNTSIIAGTTSSPQSTFTNAGANATLNVKASQGSVYSLTCSNTNAATRYIQLHDTATVPAGGASAKFSFQVPSGSQIVIGTDFFTTEGAPFATGIAFAFSTTDKTYTAGAAGDQNTAIIYS